MMDRREARLECIKELLGMGYEWLARDKDGTALCYDKKPFKIDDDEWNFDDEHQYLYLDNSDDINFVKWEDEEPVNIREWIKKEEEEMMNRREARYASVDLLLDNGYQWLARDLNGSIAAYSDKPFKFVDDGWLVEDGESKEMWVDDGDLYNFVKWEDDEPVNIREWLEKEEEEMKMYSVKDGELECREVDADFFGKNTTLGGLLTPKEVELDMDNAIEARKQLNSVPDTKISFNDMVVKACAMALRKHPAVNSTWTDAEIIQHGDINIGVAVAVEDGLLVPVVKNTDQKSFAQISAEVKDYAGRARDRKLKADEMDKSTFSVSNLGMFGIESFTSIINQPNSCILSVGAIIQKPVVKDGQIVVGNTMKLSLACDHRTVDGATGAQFLQTLRMYIENPVTMLV